jgi:hypothetical protein
VITWSAVDARSKGVADYHASYALLAAHVFEELDVGIIFR